MTLVNFGLIFSTLLLLKALQRYLGLEPSSMLLITGAAGLVTLALLELHSVIYLQLFEEKIPILKVACLTLIILAAAGCFFLI